MTTSRDDLANISEKDVENKPSFLAPVMVYRLNPYFLQAIKKWDKDESFLISTDPYEEIKLQLNEAEQIKDDDKWEEIWKKLNVLMQHLKEQKLGHQLYTSTQISHLEKCIKQFKRTIYPYTEPTDCETLFFSRKRIEKNQDLRLEEARRFAINIFKAIADPVANQRLLDNACQYMRNRKLKIIGAAIIAVISVAVVIFGGFTFNPACLIAGTTGFMGSLFAAGHFKNSGYLHNQVTDIAHTIEPQKRYYK